MKASELKKISSKLSVKLVTQFNMKVLILLTVGAIFGCVQGAQSPSDCKNVTLDRQTAKMWKVFMVRRKYNLSIFRVLGFAVL